MGQSSLSAVRDDLPDDCTGVARAAYERAGVNLLELGSRPGENGVTAMYRAARVKHALHWRHPHPGDLVFFHETYDRNRDGLRNDGLTHVGVVVAVDRSTGTVSFVHRGGNGVKLSHLNLLHPALLRAGRHGAVLNDYLRRQTPSDRAYLTGELFSGFASPDRW